MWESTEERWLFNSVQNKRPNSITLPSSLSSAILKNLEVSNLRVYWNAMSNMTIPSQLWLNMKGEKKQIFEAIPASTLRKVLAEYSHPSN